MPGAILINPDDPLFDFEHMMETRQYFALLRPLAGFSVVPYLLDPAFDPAEPAWVWNLRHQQSHNDFNHDLPSNYNDGYYANTVTPVPPPTPPPPPYVQAYPLEGGSFGIPQDQILLEGVGDNPGSRAWWTFANHLEHFIANDAILPLPTDQPTTAGTPPGQITASNPWWWASRAPVIYPFW